MDKNTLIGLLLMGLVIFGFMWLNPATPEEQTGKQATESITKDDNAGAATLTDSISAEEAEAIKAAVRQYGKAEDIEGKQITSLASENVKLTVDGESLDGEVQMNDTVLEEMGISNTDLSYEDILADDSELRHALDPGEFLIMTGPDSRRLKSCTLRVY